MSLKLKVIDIFKSKDPIIQEVVKDKVTLEIVVLLLKYNIEKKTMYADKFLENNNIKASRSKKIGIIQNLEKIKILERKIDNKDKRKKIILISEQAKNKLNQYFE
ncbi:hypothetical protein [Candidatus Pelagibacter sp. HIMB1709]|uniref:hypothetical protein n=1 Tax=Candidatus Pelagibacter sp. HIMB1709 TaxID=3413367 RepID=UPI003F86DEB1